MLRQVEHAVVNTLVDGKLVIPPYPKTACQLTEALSSPNYSMASLARIVAADQALSAACLRLANGASGATSTGGVRTLDNALSRIGVASLKQIAIAIGIGAHLNGSGPLEEVRTLLWRRSTMAAALCQRMAARRGLPPDEAFLAGLLHDLGSLIVVMAIETHIPKDAIEKPSLDEWLSIIERHHVYAGDVIARRWRLPKTLTEVIQLHHSPMACPAESRPFVDLVGLVDRLILQFETGPVLDATRAPDPSLTREELSQIFTYLDAVASDVEVLAPLPQKTSRKPIVSAVAEAKAASAETAATLMDAALLRRTGEVSIRVVGVARDELVLQTPEPLSVNALTKLELRLNGRPPFTLWATVTKSSPHHATSWLCIARPFGLSGPSLSAWLSILTAVRSAICVPHAA